MLSLLPVIVDKIVELRRTIVEQLLGAEERKNALLLSADCPIPCPLTFIQ